MQSQSDLWSDRWRWLDGHHFWHRVARCASSINSYDKNQIDSITAQFQEEGGRASCTTFSSSSTWWKRWRSIDAASLWVSWTRSTTRRRRIWSPTSCSFGSDSTKLQSATSFTTTSSIGGTRGKRKSQKIAAGATWTSLALTSFRLHQSSSKSWHVWRSHLPCEGGREVLCNLQEVHQTSKSSSTTSTRCPCVQWDDPDGFVLLGVNLVHAADRRSNTFRVAPSMDRSPSISWRPSWNSGFTTLGLLNVWCLISKWHWWAMTLLQNLNAWESTVALAVLPLALAQSSTLAQASCRGMSSWPSSRCSSSVQNFNDKVYNQLNLSLDKKQPWPRTWLCPMVVWSIHGRLRHHASGVLQPWHRARDEHRRSSWDRSDSLRTGSSNQTDIPCTSTTICHWRQSGTSFKNEASPIGCWRACGWNLWSWILQGGQERPRMEGTSSFTTPWCWWRSCHHTVSRKALSGLFATHPSFPRHLPHGGADPSNGWCTLEAHEVRGEHVRVQGVPLWLDPQTEWVLGAAAKEQQRGHQHHCQSRDSFQGPHKSHSTWCSIWTSSSIHETSSWNHWHFDHMDSWWKRLLHSGAQGRQPFADETNLQPQQGGHLCPLLLLLHHGQRRSHPSKCPSKEGEHRGQAWRSWNIQPNSNGRRSTEQKTRRPRITHCDSFSWEEEEAEDCLHQERDRVHAALVQRHNASFQYNLTSVKIGVWVTLFWPQLQGTSSCRSTTLTARTTRRCSSPLTTSATAKPLHVSGRPRSTRWTKRQVPLKITKFLQRCGQRSIWQTPTKSSSSWRKRLLSQFIHCSWPMRWWWSTANGYGNTNDTQTAPSRSSLDYVPGDASMRRSNSWRPEALLRPDCHNDCWCRKRLETMTRTWRAGTLPVLSWKDLTSSESRSPWRSLVWMHRQDRWWCFPLSTYGDICRSIQTSSRFLNNFFINMAFYVWNPSTGSTMLHWLGSYACTSTSWTWVQRGANWMRTVFFGSGPQQSWALTTWRRC